MAPVEDIPVKPTPPGAPDPFEAEWQKRHAEACAQGEYTYRDPATGYTVFTRLKLLERGYCCKSGCRHCPYPPTESQDPEQS